MAIDDFDEIRPTPEQDEAIRAQANKIVRVILRIIYAYPEKLRHFVLAVITVVVQSELARMDEVGQLVFDMWLKCSRLVTIDMPKGDDDGAHES